MIRVTDTELDTLSKMVARATPGPWRFVVRSKGDGFVAPAVICEMSPKFMVSAVWDGGKTSPQADCEFIAAARAMVPRIIHEIVSLRDQVRDHGEGET